MKQLQRITLRIQNKAFKFFVHVFTTQLLKKIHKQEKSKTGLCLVLCRDHVSIAIVMLTTFMFFSKKNHPVYIVDDGTLTRKNKSLLRKLFSAKVLGEKEKKKAIKSFKKEYPTLYKFFSSKKTNVYKYKLLAVLTSPFNKCLLIDADIIFLNKPVEINKWLNSRRKVFLHSDLVKSFYAYCSNNYDSIQSVKSLLFSLTEKKYQYKNMLTAIVGIPETQAIKLESINSFLKKIDEIDMLHFSHMEELIFSQISSNMQKKQLSPNKYFTFITPELTKNSTEITALHVPGKNKSKLIQKSLVELPKINLKYLFFRHFS